MKGFKELLEECKEFVVDDPNYYGLELSTKEVRLVVEALEKQIPKKPVDTCNTPPVDLVYCPICYNSLTDAYGWEYNYCPECGQAIRWEDE